jgi:Lar family restriction alleviation protein
MRDYGDMPIGELVEEYAMLAKDPLVMAYNETETLGPCPFCGGEASKRLFYKGKYRVHCNACDAHSGDVCDTEAEAIAAWNTRAELGSEPPYDELIRCLENDWHINASWDGLRKFWCIELTDEGMRMRDSAHGTLTAEQVREAIEKRFDFDVWVPKERWRAIADELNAAMGSGTCEMETSWEIRDELGIMDAPEDTWGYRCSACGCSFRYDRGIKPRYCPECRAEVKR